MALFSIKFTHSLIIIYMMVCLFFVWQYALIGDYHPFTKWAFASIFAEAVVFVASGFECPLTIWALNLGDETGADFLSELFLLENVDFTKNYILFFVVGLFLSLRQYRIQRYI